MSHSNEAMGLAYAAGLTRVGLVGHEVAAQRYRNAIDAAVEVLKPHIAAEALRMLAGVNVSGAQGRERVYEVASMATTEGRDTRIRAAIDAATPLIEAGALRAAALNPAMPAGAAWPLNQLAEDIEKGEAS